MGTTTDMKNQVTRNHRTAKRALLAVATSILLAAVGTSVLASPKAPPLSGTGVLKARCWVELRVWEEGRDGKKGRFLGEYKLEKNASRAFTSETERLRYDYRIDSRDSFHGDVGAWCHRGDVVSVP